MTSKFIGSFRIKSSRSSTAPNFCFFFFFFLYFYFDAKFFDLISIDHLAALFWFFPTSFLQHFFFFFHLFFFFLPFSSEINASVKCKCVAAYVYLCKIYSLVCWSNENKNGFKASFIKKDLLKLFTAFNAKQLMAANFCTRKYYLNLKRV